MGLDKLVIGILVLGAIMLAGVGILTDLSSNYDAVDIDNSKFSGVYNTTNEIYNLSSDMRDQLLGGEIDSDTTENSLFKGAYAAIRLMMTPFRLMGQIASAIATEIGISQVYVTLAIGSIAIFIFFSIIFLIFRVRS